MHIRARYTKQGGHYHIRIFVGKNSNGTLAKAGDLCVSEDELDEFMTFGINEWVDEDKES